MSSYGGNGELRDLRSFRRGNRPHLSNPQHLDGLHLSGSLRVKLMKPWQNDGRSLSSQFIKDVGIESMTMSSVQRTLLPMHTQSGVQVSAVHMKPYLQPFEEKLAKLELEGLGFKIAHTESSTFLVSPSDHRRASEEALTNRLSYFDWFSREVQIPTLEACREGAIPSKGVSAKNLPNRRVLRFGPHDFHKYRGKFFPQLVRSVCNWAQLEQGDVVLDPMCGSGTTLVEARALDLVSLGVDRNPLSCLISTAKVKSLSWDQDYIDSIEKDLSASTRSREHHGFYPGWSNDDLDYLARWFDETALKELGRLLSDIDSLEDESKQQFGKLCLSDVLRSVSYQKEDELRVRKEVKPYTSGQLIERFDDRVKESLMAVRHLNCVDPGHSSHFEVHLGDARAISQTLGSYRGKVDAVITSPPYATALPYLDTDRLSLVALKLLDWRSVRRAESEMIGTREVTQSARKALWKDYLARKGELPVELTGLIDFLQDGHSVAEAGFRRRNLPSLLWGYFSSMKTVLKEIHKLLRRGGMAYFVVGNNSTVVQGLRVEIPTDGFLSAIATDVGFTVKEPLNMELLVSRDIFRHNRGSREQLIPMVRT